MCGFVVDSAKVAWLLLPKRENLSVMVMKISVFPQKAVNLPYKSRLKYSIMLKGILSISGKPGLFRLVSQGKNSIIVESLSTGKRMPVQARDRIISLADVAMYTVEEDVALADVLTSLSAVAGGKAVDSKALADAEVRGMFAEVLPAFDRERVHTSDIRKLLSWYNLLLAAGITSFKDDEVTEGGETAAAPEA